MEGNWNDKEFVLEAVKRDGEAWIFASKKLQEDKDVLIELTKAQKEKDPDETSEEELQKQTEDRVQKKLKILGEKKAELEMKKAQENEKDNPENPDKNQGGKDD